MIIERDVTEQWEEWRSLTRFPAMTTIGDEMAAEIRRLREQLRVAREALSHYLRKRELGEVVGLDVLRNALTQLEANDDGR